MSKPYSIRRKKVNIYGDVKNPEHVTEQMWAWVIIRGGQAIAWAPTLGEAMDHVRASAYVMGLARPLGRELAESLRRDLTGVR